MKHVKAFAIKFMATFVLLYLVLGGVQGITFGDVFLMSLLLGAASYLLGDLFLLKRTSSTVAALADLGLAFILIYFMSGGMSEGGPYLIRSVLAALAIMVFELFFHQYVIQKVLPNRRKARRAATNLRYQTEASEQIHPEFPIEPTDEFHLNNRDRE
jgi:uncharacterized protein (DUF2062 family)